MSDQSTSADVFGLVGHEARTAILRALLAAQRDPGDPHVAFSELRAAAGIADAGRFNYHLGKLVDALVVRTDDGYRLSAFGFRVLAPMTAGLYDPDPDVADLAVPGACHDCGDALRVRPDGNVLQLVCESGHTVNQGLVGYPALVADRPPEEAATALGLLNAQATELGVAGVCPVCHGRTEGEIEFSEGEDRYQYRAPCRGCGNQFATAVGDCVAAHPRVVRFLADRGVDVRRTAPWTLPFRQAGAEEVVSEDPLRLRVVVGEGVDGELRVTVDRQGEVVEVDGAAR